MSSADPSLDGAERARLLVLARESIELGVRAGRALETDAASLSAGLLDLGASFVTLRRGGELRGCIGSLEASRPLAEDVAQNAFSAAFHDPRFPALESPELDGLEIEVSILSAPEPVRANSQSELVALLRPGVDGVILREGAHRATFLPQVWQSLPEPDAFLRELKRKAGLSPNHWSRELEVQRYTVESIP